ncbi:putative zinc-binding oxidoreductase ToxD [Sclerotinia borealis F-4128]|uniref:Putative zinc-binding oxidoreductase ToxD n=1 Tax=Sclerotinia borealis (strain F-4128) TaxID=1432307 RepID=W9CFV4_SCLBF|nr:putative zinc-binding oxidoreductase ToxD [Sclerotinia borealis F-4128]
MTSTLQNHGIVKTAIGEASLQPIPVPRLLYDYILVETIAVSLNPTNWQTVGNDIEPEDGTFASYIMVKGDVAFHIPDRVSFEKAASLGCGVTTVALGLYKYLSLSLLAFPPSIPDPKSRFPILVYGGSSATGTLVIQSGLEVITTSSPKNFELLKGLGADHVLNYHDPTCGAKIRSLTQNKLHHVFGTIANTSSAHICADALSSSGDNLYVNLMGVEMPRDDVKSVFFLGYSVTGEAYEMEGNVRPAAPEDFELGKKVFVLLEKLLEDGLIRNHPVRSMNGGLIGILEGMRDLKEGKVSGEKLVYRVREP